MKTDEDKIHNQLFCQFKNRVPSTKPPLHVYLFIRITVYHYLRNFFYFVQLPYLLFKIVNTLSLLSCHECNIIILRRFTKHV